MATAPSRILQYSSCSAGGDLIRQLGRGRFEGLYHVCGTYPWLYIRAHEVSPGGVVEPHQPVDLRRVRTGLVSWADQIESSTEAVFSPNEESVLAFVFARPFPPSDQPLEPLKIADCRRDGRGALLKVLSENGATLRRVGEPVDGEWWYVAEALFVDQSRLSEALRALVEAGLDTATKCVLLPWIDRETDFYQLNSDRRQKFWTDPRPNLDHRAAMVVRNSRTFFEAFASIEDRTDAIRAQVETGWEGGSDRPSTPLEPQLYWKSPGSLIRDPTLVHDNDYVKRFTLRPVSNAWQVQIIFLRAERRLREGHGGVTTLRKHLHDYIGVHHTVVLPRVYKVTGDYDYLLVAYVLGDRGKTALINFLSRQALPLDGKPVVLSATIPKPCAEGKVRPLSTSARSLAVSLFRNAVNLESFFQHEYPALQRLWNKEGDATENEVELGSLSSRARSIFESSGGGDPLPVDLAELGLGVTWELSSERVNAAFVRLRPKSLDRSYELRDAIHRVTRADEPDSRHEIVLDWYLSDQQEVLGIARYEKFAELERFLHRVRKYCSQTEFHIILDQIASIPDLSEQETCLPCVSPADVNLNHNGRECGACSRYAKHWGTAAAKRILIDKRKERELAETCSVAVVDVQWEISFLRQLRDDDESQSSRTREYADALANLVSERLEACDLVVLPEYCVPQNTASLTLHMLEKTEKYRDKQRLIVLGSHGANGANISPIVWSGQGEFEVWTQAKRRSSRHEQELGFLSRFGDAIYLFRTPFGNIAIGICSDLLGKGDKELAFYSDVDIIAAPSFHPGRPSSMAQKIQGMPTYNTRTVALANGAAATGVRMPSQLIDMGSADTGTREPFDLAISQCDIATFEVNLVANDRNRAAPKRGRNLRTVHPIHFDSWSQTASPAETAYLEKYVLAEMPNIVGVAKGTGRLEDYISVDWARAHSDWQGSTT